ncbi:MAG TPA: SHOCT domain-containing protein [Streptosporangiaceae bacterium]
MLRRRRPLLRAAAVGGTAYAVGRHSGRQREQAASAEADQDQRIADLEQQQAAPAQYQQPPPQYQQPPPPPPPAPAQPSMLDQLNQLTELHQQGALSDEEFSAAKAKLLG